MLLTLDGRVYGYENQVGKFPDPKEVVEDIFALSDRNFASIPLKQSSCRTYISINARLEGKTVIAKEICNLR